MKRKTLIKKKEKTTEQLKLWEELQGVGLNQYLESVAIIELVIDNKKEMFSALHKEITPEVFQCAVYLANTMRKELTDAAKISIDSKKKFKTILAKIISQKLKG